MQKGKRDLDTKKRIKRRQQRAILRVVLALFIVGGLTALLYSVPRFPQITISQVTVSGNEVVHTELIKQVAEEQLTGFFAFIFPKHSIFLYPKASIAKAVEALDPRILTASVSSSNLQSIKVSVVERKPFAQYCGGASASTSSKCYFLDHDGFIFSEAPQFSDTVFITFYGSTTEPVIGSSLLPKEEFRAISYATDRLSKLKYQVDSVSINENGLVEMKLVLGGKLLFSENHDYGKALNNLEALLADANFKAKDAAGVLQIDYIDLRFGNKVFYKALSNIE